MARFNRIVTNRVQGTYAWAIPPWVVILHRGRRSGRLYRTPVMGFRRGRTLAVPILYGEGSDWVQNLLVRGGQVVRAGRTYDLLRPRVVDARDSDLWPAARTIGRLPGRLLVAELAGPRGGFGRGPAAG